MSQAEELYRELALVRGIVEGAFFSPLRALDWPAFCFNQPGLLGLEEEEAFDLFVRGALAAETVYPEAARGRAPLAWLWAMSDPEPVLAHVLASLRQDRPLLFHRLLYSLGPVRDGSLDPGEYELVEDYLAQALGGGADIRRAAAGELSTLTKRGLAAAGWESGQSDPRLTQAAREVLAKPQFEGLHNDAELLTWLTLGGGLRQVPDELAPAVLVMVWAAWCAAVVGAPPNLEMLQRLQPQLDLAAPELALYAPPDRQGGQVINTLCPYCQTNNSLRLGPQVEELNRCPHLIYVGTSDEAHLLQVLGYFELGADFKALLESYYRSPADLEMFATIVDDLYEMLSSQGRLTTAPVHCAASKGFYFLKAFFAGPPAKGDQVH
ncbi:MAG: hypothetical protein C4525_15430 [Desulfarculus sp.]|nr:MAG: hypothetical protein C4525_15430 [Desulfarculus sp.]